MKAVSDRTSAGIARDDKNADAANTRMSRAQIFGFVTGLSSIAGGVYLGVYATSWPVTVVAVALIAMGIGGPNVARLIADRLYLSRVATPPKSQR